MTKKIAFFDVDGTLVGDSGKPTRETVSAIQTFKSHGNLAFVCTGRSRPEILPEIMAIGFDGIIGAGGGYISVGDEVVHHHTMPEQDVRAMIQFFKENGIEYYLESNSGLFGSEQYAEKINETIFEYIDYDKEKAAALSEKNQWFNQLIDSFKEQTIDYGDINKISFINNTFDFNEIHNRFGQQFEMFHMTVPFFGKESGEIAVKGNDKATAIKIVLDKLGMTQSDAISFGDANNDLAMFSACDYNVAMGNGTDELKAAADEITESADQDGIAKSLIKNNYFKA